MLTQGLVHKMAAYQKIVHQIQTQNKMLQNSILAEYWSRLFDIFRKLAVLYKPLLEIGRFQKNEQNKACQPNFI